MITDTTLQDVLRECKLSFTYPDKHKHLASRGGYLPLLDAIKYLINRGLSYGICFSWQDEPQRVSAGDPLNVNVDLATANAIVTVQSLTLGPSALHCVVYNHKSKSFFDPQEKLEQDVSRYSIVEWSSVVPIGD